MYEVVCTCVGVVWYEVLSEVVVLLLKGSFGISKVGVYVCGRDLVSRLSEWVVVVAECSFGVWYVWCVRMWGVFV